MDLTTDYGRELHKLFDEKENIYSFETFRLRIELLNVLKNSGQIKCQDIKPAFTILEIELLENLIRDNREEMTYYGNKKHYHKRLDTIEKKLNEMRKTLYHIAD